MFVNRLKEFTKDDKEVMKWLLMDNDSGMLHYGKSKTDKFRTEKDFQTAEWIKQNSIRHTSKYRESPAYSLQLSIKAFKDQRNYIKKFHKFTGRRIYGYQMVINPQKLTYHRAARLNRKIIKALRKNFHIAIISASLEHTYQISNDRQHANINVHWQYIIVATRRLNQRNIYRRCKSIAHRYTNSPVNVEYRHHQHGKPFEMITNWRKAISYQTKQQGRLPLPLLHNQHRRLKEMPLYKILFLIATDLRKGKGIARSHLYGNMNNPLFKAWKQWRTQQKQQRKLRKQNSKYDYFNEHSTVFPHIDYFKLNPHARVRNSKHHGGWTETKRLYKYGDRYFKPKPTDVQLNLFDNEVVNL